MALLEWVKWYGNNSPACFLMSRLPLDQQRFYFILLGFFCQGMVVESSVSCYLPPSSGDGGD